MDYSISNNVSDVLDRRQGFLGVLSEPGSPVIDSIIDNNRAGDLFLVTPGNITEQLAQLKDVVVLMVDVKSMARDELWEQPAQEQTMVCLAMVGSVAQLLNTAQNQQPELKEVAFIWPSQVPLEVEEEQR